MREVQLNADEEEELMGQVNPQRSVDLMKLRSTPNLSHSTDRSEVRGHGDSQSSRPKQKPNDQKQKLNAHRFQPESATLIRITSVSKKHQAVNKQV